MQISFLGATGTVTGSKYLLQSTGSSILVDCGLFQGHKELRLRNWDQIPLDYKTINAIVITHAHIDHTGYLPLLVKKGYSGEIYATKPTKELCSILLPDSGYLQEEDAHRANKYGYSKHKPALPLYTEHDGVIAAQKIMPVNFGQNYQITDDFKVEWNRAGHILGASFLRIEAEGQSILFSGDLGRYCDPIMRPPVAIQNADYIVVESTYGNRLHDKSDPEKMIGDIINATAKNGGTVLIPSFAVGRSQIILYHIYRLKEAGVIPDLDVYLDSPMAIDATKFMCMYEAEHKLTAAECKQVFGSVHYTNTVEQSKAIGQNPMPKIVISASGMATGGRVLHHLKQFAPDHRNSIIFAGYQAGGTRGDRMVNGAREVKIHGTMVSIRSRVESLSNTSAHADYEEVLQWLSGLTKPPRKVFITHGEAASAISLKEKIEEKFGWECYVPEYLEKVEL